MMDGSLGPVERRASSGRPPKGFASLRTEATGGPTCCSSSSMTSSMVMMPIDSAPGMTMLGCRSCKPTEFCGQQHPPCQHCMHASM